MAVHHKYAQWQEASGAGTWPGNTSGTGATKVFERVYADMGVNPTLVRTIVDIQISFTAPFPQVSLSQEWWSYFTMLYSVNVVDLPGFPARQINGVDDPTSVVTGMMLMNGEPFIDPAGMITARYASRQDVVSEGQRKNPPLALGPTITVGLAAIDPAGLIAPVFGYSYGWICNTFLRTIFQDS